MLARFLDRFASPLSAFLLLLAFSPANLYPLVFVALVPLLAKLRTEGVRPFRQGYVFGLVYGAGQLFWLGQLTERWTGSVLLGAVPFVLCVVLFALYFGLVAWLIQRAWLSGRLWLIPIAWAGVEVFRSYIPVFAFPWALIASPLWHAPILMQTARLGTIFLTGAWVVTVNLLVTLALLRRGALAADSRPNPAPGNSDLLLGAVWTFAGAIASFAVWLVQPPAAPTLLTLGQPGVDLAFGDPKTADLQLFASVSAIEKQVQPGSRVLILPEGIAHAIVSYPPDLPFPLARSLPTLFGGQRGKGIAYQTAFAVTDGQWSWADKTRLVIFGEFVPGRSWIPFLDSFNLPSGDLQAGSRVTALEVGGLPIGPVICFESLFPDIATRQAWNGSRLLAVMSMDDWFMGTTAPDQLRAASVWRAVETGLPLVRAATNGYTFAVDSHGSILATAPLSQSAALNVTVPVPTSPASDWWLPLFPIGSLLMTAATPLLRGNASKYGYATH